jgi:hypothetical protein
MRKIMKRLTIALAFIAPVFLFISAGIESGHDRAHSNSLLACSAMSPFAVFGAYFLGDWILTGRSPFKRAPKPTEKPIA